MQNNFNTYSIYKFGGPKFINVTNIYNICNILIFIIPEMPNI